jgi:uncharacterized protein YbjT (DUF2867 family)
MNLIVGATGLLGGEICRLLTEQGKSVRALVRKTSNPEKVAHLRNIGAELVLGDLKDRQSLEVACHGVDAIISTASAMLSRQAGDVIESVDHQGQLTLIDVAETSGVRHFVFVSFPNVAVDFPLQSAKRAVEERLQRSQMTYTILQPTFFIEIWLSPILGFDARNAIAQIYGSGQNKSSWISFHDVAKFAIAALDTPEAKNAIIKLGGPEALSPLEVVHLAEQTTGKHFVVQHISEESLRRQYKEATDCVQQSFAGLMLYYANGDVIDMTEPLRLFAVEQLKSVHEYFQAIS